MSKPCPKCGLSTLHKRGSFTVDDDGNEKWIKWQYYCKICDYSEKEWMKET